MAAVRVVLRMTMGEPWRRTSGEERKTNLERWNDIRKGWKKDPGIRFLCYYSTPGGGVDGYAHHWIFEVDDLTKIEAIDKPIGLGEIGPFEKYSIEIVRGNKAIDHFWQT